MAFFKTIKAIYSDVAKDAKSAKVGVSNKGIGLGRGLTLGNPANLLPTRSIFATSHYRDKSSQRQSVPKGYHSINQQEFHNAQQRYHKQKIKTMWEY